MLQTGVQRYISLNLRNDIYIYIYIYILSIYICTVMVVYDDKYLYHKCI